MFKVPSDKVFSGKELFDLHSTYGFQIETSLCLLVERGFVVNWEEFIEEAIRKGWDFRRTLERIKLASLDAGYTEEFMVRNFELT